LKITTIPIAVILVGLVVTSMAAFFNDANDLNLAASDTTINGTYDKIVEIGNLTGSVNTLVQGTAGGGEQGNFLTDVGGMWGAVKTMFQSFGQVSELTESASTDLTIPDWVRTALIAIIAVAFLGLLVSIAVRWNAS